MSGVSFSIKQQALTHTLQEASSVAGNQTQPVLKSFLDDSWLSSGLKWAATGYGVLWDLRKEPQAQHCCQTGICIKLVNAALPS